MRTARVGGWGWPSESPAHRRRPLPAWRAMAGWEARGGLPGGGQVTSALSKTSEGRRLDEAPSPLTKGL